MKSGLFLCDDLIFTSRVTGTGQALGLPVRAVKTTAELLRLAQETPPACVIVELHTPGLVIADLMTAMNAMSPRPYVVAFGSHVDVATLKKAREAGCDLVLPRSKFVEELPTAMPMWFERTRAD
jgi:CheY-like chemotaxis protein